MQTNLTMSQKEIERLKVLTRIKSGELTVSNAAECLRISERHIYRCKSSKHFGQLVT